MSWMAKEPLDAVGLRCGTDKASDWHNYLHHYEDLIGGADIPDGFRLLELGWGYSDSKGGPGASARMWREWLPPDAQIVVFDRDFPGEKVPGVVQWRGDQADQVAMTVTADAYISNNGPWDFIVDDASHLSSLTIKSFEVLWDFLAPGGWYVVEDLAHMSYHAHFYGTADANPDPDRSAGSGPTAMQYFKRLADEVNAEYMDDQYRLGYAIDTVIFRRGTVAIHKKEI